jgi:target of rapamycin complex 2 subunit MAPKAP1
MGVGGRRRSDAKRLSSQTLSPESASARDGDGESVTTVATTTTSYSTVTSSTSMTTMTSKSPPRQEQQQQQQQQQVSTGTDAPPQKPVFVPKFKGAAEMDERRRLRLQARRGVAAAAAADAATSSAPEIRIVAAQENSATLESSGDEEEVEEEDSFLQVEDEDFDDVVDVGVSVDIDEDGFDPCVVFFFFLFSPSPSSMSWSADAVLCVSSPCSEFATTRLASMISDSVSDGLSGVSASLSASNSFFNVPSPPHLHSRSRARLSTVAEDKIAGGSSSASSYPDTRPSEPGFDMITVLHSRTSEHPQAAAAGAAGAPHTTRSNKHRRTSHGTNSNNNAAHTSPPTGTAAAAEEDLFARQKVAPIRAAKSALSSMMAASNTTNPFSDLYSAISGRGVSATASMVVTVFFPFAREPAGEPMRLRVRKDATVEEVLGFGLWSYWENGWSPRLDDEDINSNTSEEKLTAVGWVMKIAEDDGEVDEDFPRKLSSRFPAFFFSV